MRKTRNILLPVLVVMLVLGSCKKDEGNTVATRDDYLGLWQCEEYDINQQFNASFQIEIFAHPTDESRILIDNFGWLGQGFQAEAVLDNTSLDIPQQFISATAINGSGYITDNMGGLELQYTMDDGSGQPENLTATCTKL